MRAFYTKKPSNNAYLLPSGDVAVCIDWIDKQVQRGKVTINGFECERVDVSESSLNAALVIEKFVRVKMTESQEFSLVNAYQASILGIDEDKEKEAEYESFLTWRTEMKKQVKEAVSKYNATMLNQQTEEEEVK